MTMMDDSGREMVRRALAEDLGERGDITSQWTVPPGLRGRAVITANEPVVVAGLPLAEEVIRQVDPTAVFTDLVGDGAAADAGASIATVEGAAQAILTAERTMLNFLMHLCGVAAQSRRFAEAVQGTGAQVVDTRKTIPGLRVWEKRAVALGGCGNHRLGLFDMVIIKTTTSRRLAACAPPWRAPRQRGPRTSR
jgi:nicotinate-nucleotide pyrophosphorylase (carboxylating)